MANKKKKERRTFSARASRDTKRRSTTIRNVLISGVILICVAATIFLLVLRKDTSISLAENGIGSLLTPVQSALTSATDSVKNFFTTWRNYDALEDQYKALERKNQQLSLELSLQAKEFIVSESYDPQYGARPLRRYLQHTLETMLSRQLLAGTVKPGQHIHVDARDGQLILD